MEYVIFFHHLNDDSTVTTPQWCCLHESAIRAVRKKPPINRWFFKYCFRIFKVPSRSVPRVQFFYTAVCIKDFDK